MPDSLVENLDTFEAAIRLFTQTMKRPQTWQSITSKAGLAIDRPAAMILLALTTDEVHQCRLHDLASKLSIEAPSVTRKVQQLEQHGLITRQQDNHDRRAYSLSVTARGHQVAKKLRNAQRENIGQVLHEWTKQECDSFVALFERFSQDIADLYSPDKQTTALRRW